MNHFLRPTLLTVSLSAIEHNLSLIKRRIAGKARMMAVVKADAYGHGLVAVSNVALQNGLDSLAVAIPEEGIQLRESGISAPILVLGGVNEAGARAAVRFRLSQTVFDRETLRTLQEEAARLGVTAYAHLKIDTGMMRIGVQDDEQLDELLAEWKNCPNVIMEGVFTHFADVQGDMPFTLSQNQRFERALERVRAQGHHPIAHAAASAAQLADERLLHDMVRVGISMYGAEVQDLIDGLIPAQQWTTYPVRFGKVPAGESIGYGRSFYAGREMRIMTLPVGYGDGYRRAISNRGCVLIRGRRAPIVGRVCMDQIMADVTDIPEAAMGDQVVLLGAQGDDRITPDEMARWADTIPYEIMLGIGSRVPREITR